MSQEDDAKKTVNIFITRAQLLCLDKYERALRDISKLGFFGRWKCRRMAEKVLGIGRPKK